MALGPCGLSVNVEHHLLAPLGQLVVSASRSSQLVVVTHAAAQQAVFKAGVDAVRVDVLGELAPRHAEITAEAGHADVIARGEIVHAIRAAPSEMTRKLALPKLLIASTRPVPGCTTAIGIPSAAPAGSVRSVQLADVAGDSDDIPVSMDQQVQKAVDCWNAGATLLHVHVRDPATGHGSVDFDQFTDVVRQLGYYWLLINRQPTEVI